MKTVPVTRHPVALRPVSAAPTVGPGWAALLVLLLLASGCAAPKFEFQVAVRNDTGQPLSIGLVKEMPASAQHDIEQGWTSPEDVAIHAPQMTSRRWGDLLPPGKTALIGPITGRFGRGVSAVLRVYVGDRPIEELLTFRRNDPDRLDVYLWPGENRYVITSANGRLAAQRQ